jgi:hypothetical protein
MYMLRQNGASTMRRFWLETYLIESSSRALSNSSLPSLFAFAFCFFSAFHSFLEVLPGDGEGREGPAEFDASANTMDGPKRPLDSATGETMSSGAESPFFFFFLDF